MNMDIPRETLERWSEIARAHGHEGMRDEMYALLTKPEPVVLRKRTDPEKIEWLIQQVALLRVELDDLRRA